MSFKAHQEQTPIRFRRIWKGMLKRCLDKNHPGYKNYGGRGIKVCKEWETFKGFRYDMWDSYIHSGANLTIDRIDSDKDYSKENCRWADWIQQNNNRRDNVRIEYANQDLTINQWARKLNIPSTTLHNRLRRYKWDIEKSFLTPNRYSIEYKGKKYNIEELLKKIGIKRTTFDYRFYTAKWSIDKIINTPTGNYHYHKKYNYSHK